MNSISGNIVGLKPSQMHALERVYRRRLRASEIVSNELAGYLASPGTPQIHTPISLGVGAAVMALLISLRRSVAWWPLSPLGYLVGSSYTVMHQLWFCVLLGWLANSLVRRSLDAAGFRDAAVAPPAR